MLGLIYPVGSPLGLVIRIRLESKGARFSVPVMFPFESVIWYRSVSRESGLTKIVSPATADAADRVTSINVIQSLMKQFKGWGQ